MRSRRTPEAPEGSSTPAKTGDLGPFPKGVGCRMRLVVPRVGIKLERSKPAANGRVEGQRDGEQRGADAAAHGGGAARRGTRDSRICWRAANAEVWDADGKRYVDFAGGI